MEELVNNLIKDGVLRSPGIIEAFRKVDRKDFVPEEMKAFAYADEALPIGQGQTISQPYTVAFMFELLSPESGNFIMDVGYGSGWTTALLAEIVGPEGKIFAFERVKELCNFGEKNVGKYNKLYKRVSFFCKDASSGVSEKLDGIIAAAELKAVPEPWREILKKGGRLVYPKNRAIFKEIKVSDKEFKKEEYPGFVFVPFIEE